LLSAIVQSRWEDFLDEATELEAKALGEVNEEEFAAAEGQSVSQSERCLLCVREMWRKEEGLACRVVSRICV
jgi:hypothetical protein